MSRKSVSAIDEAKKWFSLKSYQSIANFNALDWMDQFTKRRKILQALDQGDQATLDRDIPTLMTNPLKQVLLHRETLERALSNSKRSPVSPINFTDIEYFHERVYSFVCQANNPSESIEDVLLRDGGVGRLLLRNSGFLVIRLGATNDEIMDGIRQWLNERRNREHDSLPSISAKGLQPQFDRWESAKILPYFDVLAWKRWSKVTLPDDHIVELLYPGLDKDSSALKRPKELLDLFKSESVILDLLTAY